MSNDRRIALRSKVSFGVGQVAEGLKNTAFGMFVMFYYNHVLGLSGSLCALALGIALIFDAVTDPLAGSLSDNWRSRLGRRHPFMYASAIPLGLAFFGLFSPPALGEWALFAWLLGFAVLTRGAMTLYHVPHIALGAEMTQNFEERTSIVAWRQAFGYVGGLTAAALAFTVFFSDAAGGRVNAAAYPPYAAVLAVLMLATIWVSALGTRREIPYLPDPPANPEHRVLARLLREVATAFENESFRWLFLGVLIVFLMVGVDGSLNLYMNEFFWELTGSQILLLTVVTPVGLILGTLFTKPLHRRFDKKPALVFGTAGWALLQIVPVGLRLLDLFPANGGTALIATLAVFRFLQGMIVQQALVSFGSMMADVTDEHELASGRRQEGIFFGAVAFSGKGASGIGTFVAGIGLDLIAWPRGVETAAEIPPETLLSLGLLFGPIVSGFAIVSVWCYAHYKLDKRRHREILAALALRRGERGPIEEVLPPGAVVARAPAAGPVT